MLRPKLLLRFLLSLLGVLSLLPSGLLAQETNFSPYSSFGLGEPISNTLARNYAMGEVGIAVSNLAYVNPVNPATYSDLRLTTYDLSGYIQTARHETATQESEALEIGGIQGLALGMPSNKSFALTFGLQPLSSIGFDIRDTSFLAGTDTTDRALTSRRFGDGGLTEAYLGGGFAATPHLNLGLNAGFVFGPMNRNSVTQLDGQPNTRVEQVTQDNFNGIKLRLGATYRDTIIRTIKKIDLPPLDSLKSEEDSLRYRKLKRKQSVSKKWKKWYWRAGAIVQAYPVSDVNRVSFLASGETGINTGNFTSLDTLVDGNFSIDMPFTFGAGLSVGVPNRLTAALDLRFTTWERTDFNDANGFLRNAFRANLGAEYVPDLFDGRNFVNRVAYRAGFSYELSNLKINGEGINEYRFYAGLGLPVFDIKSRRDFFSHLNIGVSYGVKGTTDQNLLRDESWRVVFGVTFNQKWFQKRRYQ